MTPYDAGAMFHSLRLHFIKESYDYFKYCGKTTLTLEKFNLRADKFLFAKLVQQYHEPDTFRNLVIANLLTDVHLYSRTLLMPEAKEHYIKYQQVHQSLSYIVKQDCARLFENQPLSAVLAVRDGQPPILLKATWQHTVHLETLLVLNQVLDFFPIWQTKITDTIRWPAFAFLCRKYVPFCAIDVPQYKKVIRGCLT